MTFCRGFDWFTDVLIVENRMYHDGKIVYSERQPDVLGSQQVPFGPAREVTVAELLDRMRRIGDDQQRKP